MIMTRYKKPPNSVCWNITSRCNDMCKFCYRELHSKELSFEEQRKVIDIIADAGIKKLTFAGGEPLLIPQINDLILYAKRKNLLVSMTTNAILLETEDKCEFFFENLDWLSLSLDGADNALQAKMGRNERHVTKVKKVLLFSQSCNGRKCKIKINTIVSKINKNNIIDLVKVIKDYSVDRWKLFQFTPLRGLAAESRQMFEISDQEYVNIIKEVKEMLGKKECILSVSDCTSIQKAYFVIFPNGDIRISDHYKEKLLGNVLKDEIGNIWANGGYIKELHEERTNFLNKK